MFTQKKLNGIAFLSFPQMQEILLSELQERFFLNTQKAKIFGDIIYFDFLPEVFDFSDSATSNSADLVSNFSPNNSNSDFLNFQSSEIYKKLPYWAKDVYLEPQILSFDSISDASTCLRKIQRSWAPYNFSYFRRAALLQEKLPHVNLKAKNFPYEIPHSPIGIYTLLDEHKILFSAKTSSCLPAGTLEFVENHEDPPSRAYLKIQESLCLAKYFFYLDLPNSKSKCFEAGACPGGWTWVLASLGASVFAVDRAELAPSLMKNPLVKFMAHDAFTLSPQEIGECDWVFSDVICYPERLLDWIKTWISSGKTKKMICTIKMQGKINWALISEFEKIPNSRIVHLNYNKHELTFLHSEP